MSLDCCLTNLTPMVRIMCIAPPQRKRRLDSQEARSTKDQGNVRATTYLAVLDLKSRSSESRTTSAMPSAATRTPVTPSKMDNHSVSTTKYNIGTTHFGNTCLNKSVIMCFTLPWDHQAGGNSRLHIPYTS